MANIVRAVKVKLSGLYCRGAKTLNKETGVISEAPMGNLRAGDLVIDPPDSLKKCAMEKRMQYVGPRQELTRLATMVKVDLDKYKPKKKKKKAKA